MMIIQIAGRLGSKPERRVTPSGRKVVNFSVAVNEKKGGADKTHWWRVTVWGDQFDRMIDHLDKGSAVIVTGRFEGPEVYTDKNGNQQVSLNVTAEMIHFSPFGGGRAQGQEEGAGQKFSDDAGFQSAGVVSGAGQANFANDDIPF